MNTRLAGGVLGLMLMVTGRGQALHPVDGADGGGEPAIFEQAFGAAAPLEIDGALWHVESRTIGRFTARSGQLLACDPLFCERARPFVLPVPQGEFEVHLALVRFEREERVALARLSFLPEPVARWTPALVAGEDAALGSFGYAVDSGISAFLDGAAWQELAERMRREPDEFADWLVRELHREGRGGQGAVRELGQGGMALFSGGYGDGGYISYWGHARDGRLAAALIDFQVLPWAPPRAVAGR